MTETQNLLEMPLYADKPKRAIPGTRFVGVTMYRSQDGSVHDVAVIAKDGSAHLGTVHLHQKQGWRPRCWTVESIYRIGNESWPTLDAYVATMALRNGIEA